MLKTEYIAALSIIALIFPTIPSFAQDMQLYYNQRYDFSFEAPLDWKIQEGVSMGDVTFQVLMFPEEFSNENLDSTKEELGFQLGAPTIAVFFENIPESDLPSLDTDDIKAYFLENARTEIPGAAILEASVKEQPWGWVAKLRYSIDVATEDGSGISYLEENITYFFKNREAYSISYASLEEYYLLHHGSFDHAVNTLTIKGIAVPEFQEIVLMILASSIVFVIIFANRNNYFKNI